ncbi:MAG: hypothetical protein E4G93_05185 [Dehalococcoidia bacterium]|nr:MAG: hypothetical protein E4G93_05185 [Dehalococcoidia bacterium]
MPRVVRVFRWIEHVVLIILLLVLLSAIAPSNRSMGSIASVPQSAVLADSATDASSALADELVGLLPDFDAFYRSALAYPFQQARTTITDPELLDFYDGYLAATGLDSRP